MQPLPSIQSWSSIQPGQRFVIKNNAICIVEGRDVTLLDRLTGKSRLSNNLEKIAACLKDWRETNSIKDKVSLVQLKTNIERIEKDYSRKHSFLYKILFREHSQFQAVKNEIDIILGTKQVTYSARVGFPNSYMNCSFNSIAIVYAHTHYIDAWLEKQKNLQEPDFQKQRTRLAELEQQINESKNNRDQASKIQHEIKTLKEELAQSQAETKVARRQNRSDVNTLVEKNFSLDGKIRNLENQCSQLNYDSLEKLQTEKNALEKDIENQQDDFKNGKRIIEIIKILRGQKTGNLTEEDAQLISKYEENFKLEPANLYNVPRDVTEDKGLKLKNLLKDQRDTYQVMRWGGLGHYKAYVRAEKGRTWEEDQWDLINDDRITRHALTSKEIFKTWSQPQEWAKTQIYFY